MRYDMLTLRIRSPDLAGGLHHSRGFRVKGLGVWGLGFGVQGLLGFRQSCKSSGNSISPIKRTKPYLGSLKSGAFILNVQLGLAHALDCLRRHLGVVQK